MHQLVEVADAQGLIRDVNPGRIAEWIKVRNDATHTNGTVSREIARSIVDGVLSIVEQLV
jgi:hypothetical protein